MPRTSVSCNRLFAEQATYYIILYYTNTILYYTIPYCTKCRDSIVVRALGWDVKVPGSTPADVNYTGYAPDTSKSLGDCLRLRSNHNLYLNGRLAESKQTYYTTLYYTILDYTIRYYIVLYYTRLYYTILYCTILDYTILPRPSRSPRGIPATRSSSREASRRVYYDYTRSP